MAGTTVSGGREFQRRNRLHKGHGLVAAAASIPSKFQTIVTDNAEKKGFSSGSKRFNYTGEVTEVPGPGKYQKIGSLVADSSSFSKKGSGGFVSKVQRFPSLIEKYKSVGPGQYDPAVKQEHYFNKSSCTSNFHKPIAIQRDAVDIKDQTPAPNQYSIPEKMTGRVTYDHSIGATAAFRSKSKRELLLASEIKKTPAPGTYNVTENIGNTSPRGTSAPFKSTTSRRMAVSPTDNPGPGTYRPFETVEMPDRKRLPRKHYLCISAPAMPLPPSPPLPGPGHYNLVDYIGEPRRYVSSSMFVSTTSRWKGDLSGELFRNPGPATYNPRGCGKQSFIYNHDSKWI